MAYSPKLKRKIANLNKAFSKLEESRSFEYDFQINVEVSSKRFEYTFESLWKTIKLFLLEEKGLECYSPMDCIKAAYQVALIPAEYEQDFIAMVRKRNEIVHIYNEAVAVEIYRLIQSRFIDAIGAVVARLQENGNAFNPLHGEST